MSGTITTPNMSLVIPVPGVEPGPLYAQNINGAFATVDSHNHTPGNGIPITPGGLNINADLPFQSNNATQLRSTRYNNNASPLSAATDLLAIYASNGNLYYNNASGDQVQITNGSSVNAGAGSITGLPSGTASVSYGGATYVFQSATNTPAVVDVGSVIVREPVLGGHGCTVSVPSALGADYDLVLPLVPGSQSFMAIDPSGIITAYAPVVQGITRSNLAPVGQVVSAVAANQTTTNTGGWDVVTNATPPAITTTGRPVFVGLQPFPNASEAALSAISGAISGVGYFRIKRGVTVVANGFISAEGNNIRESNLPGSLWCIDPVSGGTYTYTLEIQVSGSTTSASVTNIQMIAYEL